MKAEIFFHRDSQEELCDQIRGLLLAKVYPAMEVVSYGIAGKAYSDRMSEMHSQSSRYIKLLHASIPPAKGLMLHVTPPIPYGFYVYSTYFGRKRAFQDNAFASLFPAVAIQDRMVMVTKRLAKDLTGVDEILAVFTPTEMGGVAEVDFTDTAATEAAMVKTAQLLREELIQNVRAYATFHDASQLDLSKLAADLGVDPKFMREALHSQANRNSFYDNLTCSLDRVTLSMNRWTKVRLTIGNDSDTGLTGLLVRISGPVEIRPQRLKIDVGPRASETLEIALKPSDLGEFPLEIAPVLAEDVVFLDWVRVHHIWLDVK